MFEIVIPAWVNFCPDSVIAYLHIYSSNTSPATHEYFKLVDNTNHDPAVGLKYSVTFASSISLSSKSRLFQNLFAKFWETFWIQNPDGKHFLGQEIPDVRVPLSDSSMFGKPWELAFYWMYFSDLDLIKTVFNKYRERNCHVALYFNFCMVLVELKAVAIETDVNLRYLSDVGGKNELQKGERNEGSDSVAKFLGEWLCQHWTDFEFIPIGNRAVEVVGVSNCPQLLKEVPLAVILWAANCFKNNNQKEQIKKMICLWADGDKEKLKGLDFLNCLS